MKKIVLFSFVYLFTLSGYSCDICGCGLGNYYIGMVPQFNGSFFGVRYHYRAFHTQIAADKTQFSNDYFNTVELWGGLNIGKRWQVLAFVPYSFNKQISDDGVTKSNGLGDIATLVNYSLLEKTTVNKHNKLVFQQLWIGAGIKAPTGTSAIDPSAADIVALANSQLGSGSTDFLFNAAYTMRINKIGFTTNSSYKINTRNKESYHFGNRFSSNNFFHYSIKKGNATIIPNIGFLYEHSMANKLNNAAVAQTGGFAGMGAAGVEVSFKKISVGFNAQAPVFQDYAEGQTQTRFRSMVHVTFAL
jgi:hypothetical protein